jgi:hypothetical protein
MEKIFGEMDKSVEKFFKEMDDAIVDAKESINRARETTLYNLVKIAEKQGISTYPEFVEFLGYEDDMTSDVWNTACQVEDMMTNKQ